MRFRAPFALIAACSAAACFSFGDLSGGGDDSASSDAASDSTTDAQAGDGVAPDAALDSGPADIPFCLNDLDATFCADFDESTDAMAGFTSLYVSDGGVNGLDDEYASSPRAYFSGNGALLVGATAHAAIVRSTGIKPTKSITLGFDLRVDSLDTGGKQVEALAIVNNSSTRSSLQMNLKNASSDLGEEIVGVDGGVTYTPHIFSKPVSTGKYVHVTIAVRSSVIVLTQLALTVTVDGVAVVDHVTMSSSFVFGPVDLYLGNAYSPGPSAGSKIHYDNVSLTVE